MGHHLNAQVERGMLVLTILDPELRTEADCGALREEFLEAVRQSGAKGVIVDFRNVHYLTSAAYRPFLALRRASHQAGTRLVLCNLSREVASLFYASGLIARERLDESPFEEQPDIETAVAYLERTGA